MGGEGKVGAAGLFLSPCFSLPRLRQPLLSSIVQLHSTWEEVEKGTRSWLSKQPLFVEAAVTGAASAFQGALLAGSLSYLAGDAASSSLHNNNNNNHPPQVLWSSPSPVRVQARNFAIMSGVNASISCAMKRIRGTDDLQTRMVAGFGSGVTFSLVSGIGRGSSVANQAATAVSSGLLFAFLQGGLFQMGQMISRQSSEDPLYCRTKTVLKKLGIEKYVKNFKRGLLADSTLPLLTDSALRDVNIPPGPRLLILDHIRRDPELNKGTC